MKKNTTTVLTKGEIYEFVKEFTKEEITFKEGYEKLLSFTGCSELRMNVQYDKNIELNDIDLLIDNKILDEIAETASDAEDLIYFTYTIPGEKIEVSDVSDIEKYEGKGYWSAMFDGQHFQGPTK